MKSDISRSEQLLVSSLKKGHPPMDQVSLGIEFWADEDAFTRYFAGEQKGAWVFDP